MCNYWCRLVKYHINNLLLLQPAAKRILLSLFCGLWQLATLPGSLLQRCYLYIGACFNRDEISDATKDVDDGSYLVRNATKSHTTHGDYTLVLRLVYADDTAQSLE